MDKRKKYYLIIDTETAPIDKTETKVKPSNMLVYDVGLAIIDRQGNVFYAKSYAIAETFTNIDLMSSAYYADKLPQYYEEIEDGLRFLVPLAYVQDQVRRILARPYIKAVVAHNAYFDLMSLNNTWEYFTGQKYFFPYRTVFYDTLRMSRQAFGGKAYKSWCERMGFLTPKTKQPQYKAETLYRYISGNDDFCEAHIGLEDVEIERQIFAECMKKHIHLEKELFNHK